MKTSDLIKDQIIKESRSFSSNENISDFIDGCDDINELLIEVEKKIEGLLDSLIIDFRNDPNTKETPHRIAKMLINEVFSGRYSKPPKFVTFPNAKKLDELYTVGPLAVNSFCSHHFVPFTGNAWIGVIPGDELLGLSKFKRLLDWIFCRPQIQEDATIQLADLLEETIKPRGLGIIIKAQHHCMTVRGVKQHTSLMTTSVMRGIFLKEHAARDEFLSLIKEGT